MRWFTSQRRSASATRGSNPEPLLIKIGPLTTNNDSAGSSKNAVNVAKIEANGNDVEESSSDKATMPETNKEASSLPHNGHVPGRKDHTF